MQRMSQTTPSPYLVYLQQMHLSKAVLLGVTICGDEVLLQIEDAIQCIEVTKKIDEGRAIDIVNLDFSKAFDKNHVAGAECEGCALQRQQIKRGLERQWRIKSGPVRAG
eukprot:g40228.t1